MPSQRNQESAISVSFERVCQRPALPRLAIEDVDVERVGMLGVRSRCRLCLHRSPFTAPCGLAVPGLLPCSPAVNVAWKAGLRWSQLTP